MSLDAAQLYALLPAIYRTRDMANGQPLLALCTVLAEQAALLEENIQQLYDDEFIETCAPWVIPYIGDLVGCDTIYEISGAPTGRRAEVANTVGYRRRKGTLLALEQVAMDVSGLPAAGVEFFKRLITTESMRHVRPRHEAWIDLRRGVQLERIDSGFDKTNRTIDVRRIAPRVRVVADPDPTPLDINLHGGGRFNIPDVGVYLWRWKSFPVTQAPAFRVDAARFLFSPLGQNTPLFNALPPRASFSRLTTRFDVPQPILRHEFHRYLGEFYGASKSVVIYADGVPIDQSRVCCRDLADRADCAWGCIPSGKVAIDPVLGRFQFAPDFPLPQQVKVSYCYGFPAEIGGGSYNRSASLSSTLESVSFGYVAVIGSGSTPTLENAIAEWNALPAGSNGLIVLPGFATLDVDLTGTSAIVLPARSQLWIVCAQAESSATSPLVYDHAFTLLRGNIEVQAEQPLNSDTSNVNLSFSGLWISGSLTIAGDAANVQLMDCTLVPGISLRHDGSPANLGEPSIVVSAAEVSLGLVRCVTGPIASAAGGMTRICSSIVDSGSRCRVAYAAPDLASEGADLHIEDSTVIGKVRVHTMELASNTIFLARLLRNDSWKAALWCSRQQAGCVRFCFLPAKAITPQQFKCLPPDCSQEDLFLPRFVSLRYGHPSYGLLSGYCPMAVWTGADNGSQMGVYYFLQQTEAIINVQLRAPEYVPFGLEVGVFLEPSRPIILSPQHAGYGYGMAGEPADSCECDGGDDLRFVSIGAGLI